MGSKNEIGALRSGWGGCIIFLTRIIAGLEAQFLHAQRMDSIGTLAAGKAEGKMLKYKC
jgi:hypothetical protein